MAHPTVMVRKDVLTALGGYREQFMHAEDYDLWLRVAERHALANLSEPILRYRFHHEQTSVQNTRQQAISALGARFAAEQRRKRGIDPFERAGRISEETLLQSGVTEDEIERAVWLGFVQQAETATRVGERAAHGRRLWAAAVKGSLRVSDREISRTPRVSVIIPCFNQGCFLADALDSVLAQTRGDWECIIINDGSTDDTREVATRYAGLDARFRYIEQDNQGVGAARNTGLGASRGRYVQFLDADDALFPSKIASQLAMLERESAPALAYCDYYRTESPCLGMLVVDRFCEPRFMNPRPLIDIASRWEESLSVPIQCFLFDRGLFSSFDSAFDPTLPNHEDWDCWIRIFELDPVIKHVPRKLAVYRRHPDSICNNEKAMSQGFAKAIKKQLRSTPAGNEVEKILRVQLQRVRRRNLDKKMPGGTRLLPGWAQKVFKQRVPWPMQKLIGRIVPLD